MCEIVVTFLRCFLIYPALSWNGMLDKLEDWIYTKLFSYCLSDKLHKLVLFS